MPEGHLSCSERAGGRAVRNARHCPRSRPCLTSCPSAVQRSDFAGPTRFVSSRCARARLRRFGGGAAGDVQPGAPSTGRFGGSAVQHGDQWYHGVRHTCILPARSSGAPVVVLPACVAWQLQPSHIPSSSIGAPWTGGEELLSSAQPRAQVSRVLVDASVFFGATLKLLSIHVELQIRCATASLCHPRMRFRACSSSRQPVSPRLQAATRDEAEAGRRSSSSGGGQSADATQPQWWHGVWRVRSSNP